MDWKLEVVVLPAADVDRSKRFYSEQLGFNVDVDNQISDEFRVVQLTPPGSACSVTIGTGLNASLAQSTHHLHVLLDFLAHPLDDDSDRRSRTTHNVLQLLIAVPERLGGRGDSEFLEPRNRVAVRGHGGCVQ